MTREPIPRWKDTLRKTAAVLALGGAAGMLVACAPEKAPPAATASVDPTKPGSTDPSAEPTTEFTPGASGKYSPQEVSQLSEGELVDRFRVSGKTPEELAASEAQVLTAYLESGTTEEELAPYLPLSIPKVEEFVTAMDEKYAAAVSEALGNGGINESTRIAHQIILNAFAMNRLAGKQYEDFQLGKTTIESATVTEGTFGSGSFKMEVVMKTDSNYADSIIGKKLGVGDEGHWYASIQNVLATHNTETYHKSGDHYTIK